MQKYNDNQIQAGLLEASGWQLDSQGEIFKQYQFANFVEALAFVNKIGALAEELEHHPDITINYNKVKLSVTTHDAGGLTALDFKLATKANDLA